MLDERGQPRFCGGGGGDGGHGVEHPDRDAQFNYISDRVKEALVAGQPAISVVTKKKELVGGLQECGA